MTSSILKSVLEFPSEREASEAGAVVAEMPGFEQYAVAVCERGSRWLLEVYDNGALAPAARDVFEPFDLHILSQETEAIPDTDWVAETQRGLPPVNAGRFIIHGSHSHDVQPRRWALEIDAGRAFGTAHHGTTRGCLIAIGELGETLEGARLLDLGTGSGVLAIAAFKASRHRAHVIAADIDPIAVRVARDNCRRNGVGAVRLFVGDGDRPSSAYQLAPFNVVTANILAKPLLKLAPRLRTLTARGGILILSGILSGQAREIMGRYRSVGFRLLRRRDIEGWATLTLRRAA